MLMRCVNSVKISEARRISRNAVLAQHIISPKFTDPVSLSDDVIHPVQESSTQPRPSSPQVVLETEFDNISSLALYDRLGFLREKRIQRFYSNFKDA